MTDSAIVAGFQKPPAAIPTTTPAATGGTKVPEFDLAHPMDSLKEHSGFLWETIKGLGEDVLKFLPKIFFGLFVLFIGMKLINCFTRRIEARLKKMQVEAKKNAGRSPTSRNFGGMDPTLVAWIVSLISNGLKCMLLVTAAGQMGISTVSILAVFSMCSLAIGLALQNLLKDLASGVMVLLFKPFVVGDLVCLGQGPEKGISGWVQEIAMFEVVILTPDNKTVIVPHSTVSIVTNYTAEASIRVDVELKVSHSSDVCLARKVLLDMATQHSQIIQDPKPQVLMKSVDDTGIALVVRAYVPSHDYLTAPLAIRWEAKMTLDEASIALARCWEFDACGAGSGEAEALPAPALLTSRMRSLVAADKASKASAH